MSGNARTLPLTITVPENHENHGIIDVIDSYASVHATYVERHAIYNLPDTWRSACGYYILFSPIKENGTYTTYVGKSDKDFTKRMRSHDEKKEGWVVALLVQRKSVEGLSSTQSSYLEGELRDVFDHASHVTCNNIARTGDWTLPEHDKIIMKQVIDSTLRIMLLRGYTTTPVRKTAPAQMSPVIPSVPTVSAPVASPPSTVSSPPMAPPKMTMAVPTLSTARAKAVAPAPQQSSTPPQPAAPAQIAPAPAAPKPAEEVAKEPEENISLWGLLFGKPKAESKPKPAPTPEEIYEALDEWRKEKGRQQHTKPWYVLEDYTLKALAEKMPKTYDELLQIPGIKEKKREKYGRDVLKVLDRFRN